MTALYAVSHGPDDDEPGVLHLERVVRQLQLQINCPTCGRPWETPPEGGGGWVAQQPGPADPCCVAMLIQELKL